MLQYLQPNRQTCPVFLKLGFAENPDMNCGHDCWARIVGHELLGTNVGKEKRGRLEGRILREKKIRGEMVGEGHR